MPNAFGNALGNSLADRFSGSGLANRAEAAIGKDQEPEPEVETEYGPNESRKLRNDLPNPDLDDGITRKFMTGFGGKVDALAEKSNSFQKLWNDAYKLKGFRIDISDDPNFSTSASGNVITLNKDVFSSPENLIDTLTHEITHVVYRNPNEGLSLSSLIGGSSRETFVNRFVSNQLLDEGEAKLMEIQVQKEIGVDITALRDMSDGDGTGKRLSEIYDRYSSGAIDHGAARQQIGELFRNTNPNHMDFTYEQLNTKAALNNWNKQVAFVKENLASFEKQADYLNAELKAKTGSLERSEARLATNPSDAIALANKQAVTTAIAAARTKLLTIQPQIDWYQKYGSKK